MSIPHPEQALDYGRIIKRTIIESSLLTGSKRAVQFGKGPIFVSPAMYFLIIRAETDRELRGLFDAIKVLRFPKGGKITPELIREISSLG